jgi:hypothetical protein
VAPFHFNLLVRKYFLGFIANVMENHLVGEIAVGINAHGDEWKMLYDKLRQGGDHWIGGDFSKYDKTLSYQLIDKALDIIQNYYQDEHYVIRKSLWIAMFNAYHLCGTTVYRCRQGNPSGNPLTVIINSLVNQMIMRYAYLEISESLGLRRSLSDFNKNIFLTTYGDDNLASVNLIDDFFNMNNISNTLALCGIRYTPPDKGEINSAFLNTSNITFLKRRFVPKGGTILAPLPLNIIKEMMLWKRGQINDLVALEATWNSVLIELTHYSQEVYDTITTHILKYAGDRSVRLSPQSYKHALQARYLSK